MREFRFAGPPRFKHQRRGLRKLIESRGVAALLFDPGLGKTATVIDYLGLLAMKTPEDHRGVREVRVLVICPLAAVDTWVTQCEEFLTPDVSYWAEALGGSLVQRAEALVRRAGPLKLNGVMQPPGLHADKSVAWSARRVDGLPVLHAQGPEGLDAGAPRVVVEVLNLDTFARRDQVAGSRMTTAQLLTKAVATFTPEVIVVDESHKIKASNGVTSKVVARLTRHARRRIILTGTVMPHGPLDVYGQWRFLDPQAFGTAAQFRARYAVMGGYMGKQIVSYRDLDHLEAVMSKYAVVARKEDSLDLPPTTDAVIHVALSIKEKQAYEDMRDNLAHLLAPLDPTTGTPRIASVPNRLAQMMRLRQITAGHLPDDTGSMHVIGESKARTIASLVNDSLAGEQRVVVFAVFTAEIDQLCRLISQPGTEVMRITGSTPPEERALLRKRFGSLSDPGRMVMVAQVKTMSLAVNELVTASHAVFASLSQQRDDLEQARARLDRQGQTRPVTFWYALAPGTVDEVILASHRERTDLEAAMLRHITETKK